jgi:exoribonuclease R
LEEIINRGEYSNENNFHYGIGSNNYTHFTSPMNRACDLLNQYLLKWLNFNEDIVLDIPKYVKYMNDAESKQYKIYKFIQKYNIYQRTDVGDTFNGVVIEMNDDLLVVYIEELHAKYQIELPTSMSISMFQNITVIVRSIMFDRIEFSLCL